MKKIVSFLIVGACSFLFEITILYFLYNIVGTSAVFATMISFLLSLIINYIATKKFVFKINNNRSDVFNFAFFIVMGVVGIMLNGFIIYLGVEVLHQNIYVYKVIATGCIMILNFILKMLFLEGGFNVKK